MDTILVEHDCRASQESCTWSTGVLPLPIQTSDSTEAGACQPALRAVHVWTKDPTWRRLVVPEKSSYDSACCHRGDCASQETVEIASREQLLQFLQTQIDAGTQLDYLDFHTHGNSGGIGFEENGLWLRHVMDLHGYSDAFKPGAHIEFHGCNVAEGFVGESFLFEVGVALLKKGGKVGASDALGLELSFSIVGGSCVPHPFGEWVTWEVAPFQGGFQMYGRNVGTTIEAGTQSAVSRCEAATAEFERLCAAGACEDESEIRQTLGQALMYLDNDGDGKPDPYSASTFRYYVALAHIYLDGAEALLKKQSAASESVFFWPGGPD